MPHQSDTAEASTLRKKNLAVVAHKDVRYVRVVHPHHLQRIVRNMKEVMVDRINKKQIDLSHGNQLVTLGTAEVHERSGTAALIHSIAFLLNESDGRGDRRIKFD